MTTSETQWQTFPQKLTKKQRAIDFLMDIFKVQAKKDESGTNTKKVCTEAAQSERVVIDEAD